MFRALCVVLLAASSMAYRLPRQDAVPFILNGQDASVGEWPHQCSLQSSGFHSCGAVYLNDVWVATAAHCIAGAVPAFYKVVCGELNLSDSTDATEYDVAEFYSHPDYNPSDLSADHAMIELTEVPSGDNVATITADASGDQDAWVGAECYITGWGQDDTGGSPDTMQEAATLALSQADCEDFYSSTPYGITEDMICVGHDQDEYVGACYGDSGGPFVCRQSSSDDWTLVGVTSWAYPPCGDDVYPSVYSRTAYFLEWISETCGGCV